MITRFGYVRVATAVPAVRAAAVKDNAASMIALADQAERDHADIVVYPELSLTGYTCADLFQQAALLDAAQQGLADFLYATESGMTVHVLGCPVAQGGRLFNCAVVVQAGQIMGVVPKTYIPGHGEYYEPRWFSGADANAAPNVRLCGSTAPFGADLVFADPARPEFCFGIEICEDLWAPVPPSSRLALAGATILLNLSASDNLVGKSEYRRQLVSQQSARFLAAYAYCSAGVGESTTDVVFGGHCLIAENGTLLAEGACFERNPHLITADVDVEFLKHERLASSTFSQAVAREGAGAGASPWCEFRTVPVQARLLRQAALRRHVDAHPFVPQDPAKRHERCQEIFAIQSTGLATRLQHTGTKHVVIGLSGGLDSTLALLVTREAFARLDLDPAGIHALTMPGFGTSERTLGNVKALCRALHVELAVIDITESCRLHLRDIGHDGMTGDIAFENAQARERTQILMDKANMLGALVVGTGDLSELALGWCTYNGDHMSMYGVNAGVPKTLVRFLIQYVAETPAYQHCAATLNDIVATPISPELLPPDKHGRIAQKTEDVVGPYELHDFFLYQAVRCRFAPAKVRFLAETAFAGQYPAAEIRKWLRVFYRRFFQQQFKRSCLPDGPKVGSLALSPRGDWRMPSDADAAEWLRELDPDPPAKPAAAAAARPARKPKRPPRQAKH